MNSKQLNILLENKKGLCNLAEEGIVLLKNENNTLPILKSEKIACFGRSFIDTIYSGYGSGNKNHSFSKTNLINGLMDEGLNVDKDLLKLYQNFSLQHKILKGYWGHWPSHYEELELTDEIVNQASLKNDKACFVIGRCLGESMDNNLEQGGFYLTDIEKNNLDLVCKYFKKVILLYNTTNIIDFSYLKKNKVDSILYISCLGSEMGQACAHILSGRVSPSGKMFTSICEKYEDYPSHQSFGKKEYNEYQEDIYVGYRFFNTFNSNNVLYPFGFGLSYTTFEKQIVDFRSVDDKFEIDIKVTNVGSKPSKEVVQIYVKKPNVKYNNPKKILIGFEKTNILKPNKQETVTIRFDKYLLSSFDEQKHEYIFESGKYEFYLGDSLNNQLIYELSIKKEEVTYHCKVKNICSLKKDISVINRENKLSLESKNIYYLQDLKKRILKELPKSVPFNQYHYNIDHLKNNICSIDEFIGSLSLKELSDLTHGYGFLDSPLGVRGNAGCFGGITKKLIKKGIRPIITADGPNGLGLKDYTSLYPCGNAVAASFNLKLIEEVFSGIAREMDYYHVDINLGPGLNIIRNQLCGRNFEYFSEDPLHSGLIASAQIKGIEAWGKSSCPKHFACNNQETNRWFNDSRVSERALREIYLKGFEYAVKIGKPKCLMTSYNKINGVYSYYQYDLIKTVLRDEWGYDGLVMTDWYIQKGTSDIFPKLKNNSLRIRSTVDILMPGNLSLLVPFYKFEKHILKHLDKEGYLTLGELQSTAKRVIELLLKLDKKN